MENRRVQCPSCGVLLSIPGEDREYIVRCGRCHSRFRLTLKPMDAEDRIIDWLLKAPQEQPAGGAPAPAPQKVDLAPEVPASGNTAVLPAIGGTMRLIRLDAQGALFEFPASKLRDPAFRCAMPRCCLQCGARVRLQTHVVIFTTQFKDSLSLEAEHSVGSLVIQDFELADMSPEQILSRLPRVPNVPPPGDLPMPYWLCEMCKVGSPIAGQIQVNSQTQEGWCRLLVGDLRRAEEFLVAAGGANTPDHDSLRKHIEAAAQNPWGALAIVVRHRLNQWFHPAKDERFIAYIPDRDHFQSEDGMAGMVVSDRRLIFHSQRRHGEALLADPMELKLTSDGGKSFLELKCSTCQIKHFCVDGDGVRRLHRALAAAHANVTWR